MDGRFHLRRLDGYQHITSFSRLARRDEDKGNDTRHWRSHLCIIARLRLAVGSSTSRAVGVIRHPDAARLAVEFEKTVTMP